LEVLIGGDFAPIGSSEEAFAAGLPGQALTDLLPLFKSAEVAVVNLECPLIEQSTPALKVGPALGARKECAVGIAAAGIQYVGLANNHIMDHGAAGLQSTIESCRTAGLRTFGAGSTVGEAAREEVISGTDTTVALVAMAEREWNLAGPHEPGANPLDIIDFVRRFRDRRECDALVVLLHAGNEFYAYPSPWLQKHCRFLVECGADVVLCQHSHTVGCYERYEGGLILYGQGNLLFDRGPDLPAEWYEGLLVRLNLEQGGLQGFELLPTRQPPAGGLVKLMDAASATRQLAAIEERSRSVQDARAMEIAWAAFCETRSGYYLRTVRGYSRWLEALNRRKDCTPFVRRPDGWRALLNLVQCESHYEVLRHVLKHAVRAEAGE